MPAITVCLPVFNGEAFVADALASIAAQTCTDITVLASDNASSDRTGGILAEWSTRLPMEMVSQATTLPMQAHFNSLLDRVGTEFYMLLCHDDYFQSRHALESALAVMRERPHVSAVYCDLAYVGEQRLLLATRKFRRAGEFAAAEAGRDTLRTARNMFGIPLLVRSSALGSTRYDPRFHYAMDIDLSWEISKRDPAWHIPSVMLANRYSGANSTWQLLRHSQRELLDLAAKHGVEQSSLDRARLRFANTSVGLQRRAFGYYERLRTLSR